MVKVIKLIQNSQLVFLLLNSILIAKIVQCIIKKHFNYLNFKENNFLRFKQVQQLLQSLLIDL